jgi:hypothetical protein
MPAQPTDTPLLRHAYVPNGGGRPGLRGTVDHFLFVDAAHELRAWKWTDDPFEPRRKRSRKPGSLIVADERMRGRARVALRAERYRLRFDRPQGLEEADRRRLLTNLEHALGNLRTLEEVTRTGSIAEGKIMIIGHGAPGHRFLHGSSRGPHGRSLRHIGGDVAAIATAGGWEVIDERLAACFSGEAGTGVLWRGAAPMARLRDGTLSWLRARGSRLRPQDVRSYGYPGLQQRPWNIPSALPRGARFSVGTELHMRSIIGSFRRRRDARGRPAIEASDRRLARSAWASAEARYFEATDSGLPAPGPARPGAQRMTADMLDALAATTAFYNWRDEAKRGAIVARRSMYRRMANVGS